MNDVLIDAVTGAIPPEYTQNEEHIGSQQHAPTGTPELTQTTADREVVGVQSAVDVRVWQRN